MAPLFCHRFSTPQTPNKISIFSVPENTIHHQFTGIFRFSVCTSTCFQYACVLVPGCAGLTWLMKNSAGSFNPPPSALLEYQICLLQLSCWSHKQEKVRASQGNRCICLWKLGLKYKGVSNQQGTNYNLITAKLFKASNSHIHLNMP